MKKPISIKTALIVTLCLISTSSAQSLKELINNALERNYQIRITQNEAEIAENNNELGNTGALPTLDVDGRLSNSFNNTKQEFSDGTSREGSSAKNTTLSASVMANWTLFNGFRVYAKRDQLRYLEQLGQLGSKFYIEQTISDLVTIYYQLVYENRRLANFQQSIEISSFRLALEAKRKAIGAGNAMTYGQALVDFQNDSIRYLTQKNWISSLKIDLNRLLSNALESEIRVTEHDFHFLDIQQKDALIEQVKNANKELAKQRLQELLAETELRMAVSTIYPKIDLFAGYQYSKTTAEVGFSTSNQSFGPSIGLSLSFNLFNGGETSRGIRNAELYKKNTSLSKEDISQSIDANLLKLYQEYHSVSQRLSLAERNLAEMNTVFETAKAQLNQGAINGYDFRLTQQNLLSSKLTHLELQFALKTIEINLNRLSGDVLNAYL